MIDSQRDSTNYKFRIFLCFTSRRRVFCRTIIFSFGSFLFAVASIMFPMTSENHWKVLKLKYGVCSFKMRDQSAKRAALLLNADHFLCRMQSPSELLRTRKFNTWKAP